MKTTRTTRKASAPATASAVAAALALAALFTAAPAAHAVTGEQLVDGLQEIFIGQNIKTLSRSEKMIVTTRQDGVEYDEDGDKPFARKPHVAELITKYYYKAPDKHAYELLSEPIEGFHPGDPNQPGSIAMDENFSEKVKSLFDLYVSKDQTYRGRKCHVLTLNPKPGAKGAFPMTWFIDKKKMLILKYVSLVRETRKYSVSTTAELYYKKVKGRWLIHAARWVTRPSNIPYSFEYRKYFSDYRINEPIEDSVFRKPVFK
ncbi:MAG: hypothetical protein AB1742_11860 [bacterium]